MDGSKPSEIVAKEAGDELATQSPNGASAGSNTKSSDVSKAEGEHLKKSQDDANEVPKSDVEATNGIKTFNETKSEESVPKEIAICADTKKTLPEISSVMSNGHVVADDSSNKPEMQSQQKEIHHDRLEETHSKESELQHPFDEAKKRF